MSPIFSDCLNIFRTTSSFPRQSCFLSLASQPTGRVVKAPLSSGTWLGRIFSPNLACHETRPALQVVVRG